MMQKNYKTSEEKILQKIQIFFIWVGIRHHFQNLYD